MINNNYREEAELMERAIEEGCERVSSMRGRIRSRDVPGAVRGYRHGGYRMKFRLDENLFREGFVYEGKG